MEKLSNYINGEFLSPLSEKYIDNINPASGKVYSLIPDSDERDVDLAVKSASEAQYKWANLSKELRSQYLLKIADLIKRDHQILAEMESIDNGKPLKLAQTVDIPRAAANMHFYGTGILHYASESHAMEDTAINYTLRQPIGIVACISPWNLPLYLFTWKIAPALASGNCVIAKPSEITPYTAYYFTKLCHEAGLPAGVLNVIHGLGPKVGEAISKHQKIKAISFTGGTKTGASIAQIAAPMFKKLSLELGGKNPNIIFDDCDYDTMLKTTIHSSFSNQGQICLCGSRIYVQKSIYDKFKLDFIAATKKLAVGNPMSESTRVGAIVSEMHMQKILSYIDLAKQEGGKILCGGHRVILSGELEDGYYVAPTIIEGLNEQCRTNQEEIFGPVVTIQPFDTEEDAIKLANSTSYGLAATLWTENLTRTHHMANELETGILWVNCWLHRDLRTPFGGIKASGVGREGGFEAFDFFTEPKNVCIKIK
jgi:aminomuconate-semialdehyde/2-hydroxymuconate-6-semialdehyde dehydrogenase